MAETSREMVNDMKSDVKATGRQAAQTGRDAISSGKDAMNDLKSQFSASELNDQLMEGYETLRKRAESAISTSETFVKDHPVATLLGVAAVGFVAGLIARRSRH